jgi:type IV pilus assembly protein PilC
MSSSPRRVAAAPAKVKKVKRKGAFAIHHLLPSLFKPGAMDLVLFSRQLAVFLRASVPLVPAIEALAEQSSNPILRETLVLVREDLISGETLSAGFTRHPDAFPRMYVDMVRAGEATGRLEIVLAQVADQMERGAMARRRLVAAMLYPALVIVLAILMIVVMTVFVLPSMAGLFREFDTELPLPTRIVLTAAEYARAYGLPALGALVVLAILAFIFSRTTPGGRFFDRLTLAIPVSGGIAGTAIVERTARTLGTLLAAGVPLVRAVELVRDATGNSVYRRHLESVREAMLRGEGFAEPFNRSKLYPPLVRQMARVGERTGTLDEFLREAADYYTQELELRINTALQLLEPALTILIALMVGFVALSVIMPIYTLIGNMR